jgi:hypothetical protein
MKQKIKKGYCAWCLRKMDQIDICQRCAKLIRDSLKLRNPFHPQLKPK